jgi:hypothetical protein
MEKVGQLRIINEFGFFCQIGSNGQNPVGHGDFWKLCYVSLI